MNFAPGIAITGIGAVSSAGWGVEALVKSLRSRRSLVPETRQRHSESPATSVLPVPKLDGQLSLTRDPRLRRASAITRYMVAAALEALGSDGSHIPSFGRLGLIFVSMNGCVNYSNRFYGEVLEDPSLASPILFPETVFNAPAGHLAALLGQTGACYTLIGDSGQFLSGVELGIRWLENDHVDACLIVGAEELDWLSTEATHLFGQDILVSEGAGALLLERNVSKGVFIEQISSQHTINQWRPVSDAAYEMRDELGELNEEAWLVDSRHTHLQLDRVETGLWRDWKSHRTSPLVSLGHSMGASLAIQCVIATKLLREGYTREAWISHLGTSQQAIGARFVANPSS